MKVRVIERKEGCSTLWGSCDSIILFSCVYELHTERKDQMILSQCCIGKMMVVSVCLRVV